MQLVVQLLIGGSDAERVESRVAHEAIGDDVDPGVGQVREPEFGNFIDPRASEPVGLRQLGDHRAVQEYVDVHCAFRCCVHHAGGQRRVDESANGDARFGGDSEQ